MLSAEVKPLTLGGGLIQEKGITRKKKEMTLNEREQGGATHPEARGILAGSLETFEHIRGRLHRRIGSTAKQFTSLRCGSAYVKKKGGGSSGQPEREDRRGLGLKKLATGEGKTPFGRNAEMLAPLLGSGSGA